MLCFALCPPVANSPHSGGRSNAARNDNHNQLLWQRFRDYRCECVTHSFVLAFSPSISFDRSIRCVALLTLVNATRICRHSQLNSGLELGAAKRKRRMSQPLSIIDSLLLVSLLWYRGGGSAGLLHLHAQQQLLQDFRAS